MRGPLYPELVAFKTTKRLVDDLEALAAKLETTLPRLLRMICSRAVGRARRSVQVELSESDAARLASLTTEVGVPVGELVAELLREEYRRRGFPPVMAKGEA